MRIRPVGGLDLATGALILGGASLVASAFIAAVVALSPSKVEPEPSPPTMSVDRPAAALSSDQVATVLTVDLGTGMGAAARVGDHIDVVGYFPHQVTGGDAVTRVLLQNVQVLAAQRSGSSVALTLGVPQAAALLLQEAQALGARPFVTLRPINASAPLPSNFSDTDLVDRLTSAR